MGSRYLKRFNTLNFQWRIFCFFENDLWGIKSLC